MSLTLNLQRVLATPECIRGVLLDPHTGVVFGTTMERPDLGNQRRISCIPAGTYKVDPNDYSPKFGDHWMLVKDVPGRSRIGIHRGNEVSESQGCILVGQSFFDSYDVPGKPASVGGSGKAFAKLDWFVRNANNDPSGEFYLVISHPAVTMRLRNE